MVRLPDTVTFDQGAVVPHNYLTALHAFRDRAAIRAGETLLVFGAAGGVGLAVIQVGRTLGAHVIAVGSTPEKRAFAVATVLKSRSTPSSKAGANASRQCCAGDRSEVLSKQMDPLGEGR